MATYENREGFRYPIVSVIVPVYNTEDYLNRCLESICCQSEQEIEIIVVDDASSDNSWQLIQDHAARDGRIVAIRHAKNKRQGGARNTGIEVARGEYLLFVDSDDYIHLDMIRILLQRAQQDPELEMIVCGVWYVADKIQAYGNLDIQTNFFIDNVLEHYCLNKKPKLYPSAWGKLWRRELFLRTGIRFPEHISMEDLATIPRLFAELRQALMVPKRLYCYQQRTSSTRGHYAEASVEHIGRALSILDEWRQKIPPSKQGLVLACMVEVCRHQATWIALQDRSDQGPLEPLAALRRVLDGDGAILAHRLQHFGQQIQPFLGHLLLYHILEQEQWQRSAAYRFSQLSAKRKVWVAAKFVSKKLHIYPLVRPFARLLAWGHNYLQRNRC